MAQAQFENSADSFGILKNWGMIDEEYYQFTTQDKMPPPGCYLFKRLPYSQIFKVIRHDGSSKTVINDAPDFPQKLVLLGFPKDKLDDILSYVYNFRKTYIRVQFCDNWGKDPSLDAGYFVKTT